MNNLKTTISGILFVGSICGTLASVSPTIPALAPYTPYFLAAAAVAGSVNSYFQKDHDTTGGTKQQS